VTNETGFNVENKSALAIFLSDKDSPTISNSSIMMTMTDAKQWYSLKYLAIRSNEHLKTLDRFFSRVTILFA